MIGRAVVVFFDILQTIVLAAAMFVIVYLFIAQFHIVQGTSMEPNFLNGDYILTEKLSYRFGTPQRGDIVVFEAPNQPTKDYIKRIVGLPGETMYVKDGKVFVNGNRLIETYEPSDTDPRAFMKEGQEVQVPEGMYIVMGDNRPHSSDSREFGPIALDSIIGKAILRYWPYERFTNLPNPSYATDVSTTP